MFARRFVLSLGLVLLMALAPGLARADWLKITPLADVDKSTQGHVGQGTCWIATAANMLAGAGYGAGANVQARANAIYTTLYNHYYAGTGKPLAEGGWPDDALTWWLNNANNMPANNYDNVGTLGARGNVPWNNNNAAMTIANNLRSCQLVGLGIRWVQANGTVFGGHAITAWGDNSTNSTNALTANPTRIKVADSDSDSGGDIQTYTETNQNGNAGQGWYLNYNSGGNPSFIFYGATLSGGGASRATGSISVYQGSLLPAHHLKYTAYTDVPIRSYKSTIDRGGTQSVTEHLATGSIDVDWTLNPVVWLTQSTRATAEFTMDSWNGVSFKNVKYTYDDEEIGAPAHGWHVESYDDPQAQGTLYGGYVIGSYDLAWTGPNGPAVMEGRLIHQFGYNTNRELHTFYLKNPLTAEGGDEDFTLTNLRFAYSDGYINEEELWNFSQWSVFASPGASMTRGDTYQYLIDFGNLPCYDFNADVPPLDPAPGIPEPAGLALVGMALLVLRRRR